MISREDGKAFDGMTTVLAIVVDREGRVRNHYRISGDRGEFTVLDENVSIDGRFARYHEALDAVRRQSEEEATHPDLAAYVLAPHENPPSYEADWATPFVVGEPGALLHTPGIRCWRSAS
jgi:hypothetical protein